MTIKVYSSIMPGDPDEVYSDHGMTVEQWVEGKADNYKRGDIQPISCMINGSIVKPVDWCDTLIREKDNVEFRVVPRGDVLGFIINPFWGASVAAGKAAIGLFVPEFDSSAGAGQRGAELEVAAARANVARLGQAIPELLGRYIRYPDYLVQPHRYFVDTTTQAMSMILSVGRGKYQINNSEIRIGATSLDDIDQVIDYQLYNPGADVSGNIAHQNWYKSPEVGATDSTSGIKLRGVTFDERTYFGNATYGNDTIQGISFGEFWSAGIEGSIRFLQQVTVVDSGGSTADVFQGAFQHLLAGMTVEVESSALTDGTYVVTTINANKDEITLETTGGTPVSDATPGATIMVIDKSGTKYRATDVFGGMQVDVERILTNGSADPDWIELPFDSGDIEIEWEANTFTTNSSGPFAACPDGETTDKVEVDIFAPQGLGVIDGESINQRSRTVRIEYREIGTTTWTTVDQVVSGNTRDQLGWTFTLNIGSQIRPEVRIRRLGAEDVATTSLDRIEWLAMKSLLETPTSYSDITTLAVTIQGSEKLANSSENRINVIATRILPMLSGGVIGAEGATRSIADAAIHVAKDLGYDDSEIDLAELQRLADIWGPRGDNFDFVFDSGTAKEALDTILRAGYAEFTIDRGVISPVRDEPRTVFEQGYSPENMLQPLRRSFQGRQVDETDGVEIEYTDGSTWTEETVLALLPEDSGAKLDQVKLDGVTDRDRAWRIGMRRRRAQKYRRWNYEFTTELDALNSQYLSYVPLLDDIPGYGKVAILREIYANRIVVSEPVEFLAGETYVVAYRNEEGDTVGPFAATEGTTPYEIMVTIPSPQPDPNARQERTHIYFGTTTRWHFPALISRISPNGPLEVSVSATNYDARVYDDDNNTAPP